MVVNGFACTMTPAFGIPKPDTEMSNDAPPIITVAEELVAEVAKAKSKWDHKKIRHLANAQLAHEQWVARPAAPSGPEPTLTSPTPREAPASTPEEVEPTDESLRRLWKARYGTESPLAPSITPERHPLFADRLEKAAREIEEMSISDWRDGAPIYAEEIAFVLCKHFLPTSIREAK